MISPAPHGAEGEKSNSGWPRAYPRTGKQAGRLHHNAGSRIGSKVFEYSPDSGKASSGLPPVPRRRMPGSNGSPLPPKSPRRPENADNKV
jgi:hypothetical protein